MASRRISVMFIIIAGLALILLSCARPPTPGRIVTYTDHGITVTLAEGWEGEVIRIDWKAWQRVQKGREDYMWVFPPLTARNIPVDEVEPRSRFIGWRFKGVEGTFDPQLSPMSSQYPDPPGLWSLDATKMNLVESRTIILDWPSLSGTEATARVFEISRGTGDLSAYWRTYVVTFNHGSNAYEFVMLISEAVNDQERIQIFWDSIEDVSIEFQ